MLRVGRDVLLGVGLCGLLASCAGADNTASAWPPIPTTMSLNVPAVWQVPVPGAQVQTPPAAQAPPAVGVPQPVAGTAPVVTRIPPPPPAAQAPIFDPAVRAASYQLPFTASSNAPAESAPSAPAPLPYQNSAVVIDDSPAAMPDSYYSPGPASAYSESPLWNQFNQRRPRQPFVILESVFLAPVHNTGGSAANYTFDNGSSVFSQSTKSVNGMIVTPRISLGLMGQRWGVGVRYWTYWNDQGSESFPTTSSQGVFAQSLMKIQTFDLEAIRRFQNGDSQLWLSGGVRSADFVRTSTISSNDFFNNTIYAGSASSGTGFHGAGLTFAVNGLSPLRNSNWQLIYGGRMSYLWDPIASSFAQSDASITSNSFARGSTFLANGVGSGNAFIAETQLGAQYNHTLQCFPVTAFLRVAGEYQYWHVNYGGDASSATPASRPNGTSVAAMAHTADSNLGLLGFTISTGFMW